MRIALQWILMSRLVLALGDDGFSDPVHVQKHDNAQDITETTILVCLSLLALLGCAPICYSICLTEEFKDAMCCRTPINKQKVGVEDFSDINKRKRKSSGGGGKKKKKKTSGKGDKKKKKCKKKKAKISKRGAVNTQDVPYIPPHYPDDEDLAMYNTGGGFGPRAS